MTTSNENTLKDNEIILGKDRTNLQRYLAFASILVIYFFYCYNFMVGTFVKPTMIYTVAKGGLAFTLKQTESIFASMSFATSFCLLTSSYCCCLLSCFLSSTSFYFP